jgi:hypothetical protein
MMCWKRPVADYANYPMNTSHPLKTLNTIVFYASLILFEIHGQWLAHAAESLPVWCIIQCAAVAGSGGAGCILIRFD